MQVGGKSAKRLQSSYKYLAFDCVRIWSVCERGWLPTIIVGLLSMFTPAIDIVSIIIFNISMLLRTSGVCKYSYPNRLLNPDSIRPICWMLGLNKRPTFSLVSRLLFFDVSADYYE